MRLPNSLSSKAFGCTDWPSTVNQSGKRPFDRRRTRVIRLYVRRWSESSCGENNRSPVINLSEFTEHYFPYCFLLFNTKKLFASCFSPSIRTNHALIPNPCSRLAIGTNFEAIGDGKFCADHFMCLPVKSDQLNWTRVKNQHLISY